MTRVLIRDLEFVLTVDPADTVLRGAAILVEDGRIAAIGPSAQLLAAHPPESVDDVVDGRRRGAVPGFVDTHVHLSETLSRGVFPDNLGTRAWVFHWAKPFYAHVGPEEKAA